MAQFPRAGAVTPKPDDPMMKRVDLNNGEIGSRSSGMPKDTTAEAMRISHVGDSGKQK